MKAVVSCLYILSFVGIADGLRRVLVDSKEVSGLLNIAVRAGTGEPPPDDPGLLYSMNNDLWGPAAARYVARALAVSQQGQRLGALIAFLGGLLGLAATMLAVWAI